MVFLCGDTYCPIFLPWTSASIPENWCSGAAACEVVLNNKEGPAKSGYAVNRRYTVTTDFDCFILRIREADEISRLVTKLELYVEALDTFRGVVLPCHDFRIITRIASHDNRKRGDIQNLSLSLMFVLNQFERMSVLLTRPLWREIGIKICTIGISKPSWECIWSRKQKQHFSLTGKNFGFSTTGTWRACGNFIVGVKMVWFWCSYMLYYAQESGQAKRRMYDKDASAPNGTKHKIFTKLLYCSVVMNRWCDIATGLHKEW